MISWTSHRLVIAAALSGLALCGGSAATAQERPNWRVELELADGVHVEAGVGTLPPYVLDLDGALRAVGVGYLEKKAPGGGSITRILKLADGRAIIYDVVIEKVSIPAGAGDAPVSFRVSLRPVTPTAHEAAQWAIDPRRLDTEFLQSYSSPLTVKDGDVLALDVLVEPRSGTKFVDYYLISNGPPPIKRPSSDQSAASARWFSANDVELSINGYELWRNHELLHKSGEAQVTGKFIWLNIPGIGQVEFTLAPPDSGSFQPDAVLSENRIVFTIGGDRYEWLSKTRIAPGAGLFHLWMSYTQRTPPATRSSPNAPAVTGWKVGASPTPL